MIAALDFSLHKTGVKTNLQLYEIKISGIYDMQVKSYRTEGSVYLSDQYLFNKKNANLPLQ